MKKRENSMELVSRSVSLLQSEIVEVTGCTEPASVAFAFLTARRHLKGAFDPLKAKATLTASREVLRNASTAVVPFLNRRGLRTVVAAGLSARTHQYNLFPAVDRRIARLLLRRRFWLKVGRSAGRKGVYVQADLSAPGESVRVVIRGRHDEIRSISRNGRIIFRASPNPQRSISMEKIMAVVTKRDRRLEAMARDFIVRQVRGNPALPLSKRVASLIRARMCGATSPIMTIVGSGNHGILLGVPLYELYRKHGSRILPAALLTLLAVIHMTGKRSRISEECGLATKAAPSLAAGMAFAFGANLAQVKRAMGSVSRALCGLKCHGARASCGKKAERAVQVVLRNARASSHSGAAACVS